MTHLEFLGGPDRQRSKAMEDGGKGQTTRDRWIGTATEFSTASAALKSTPTRRTLTETPSGVWNRTSAQTSEEA